MKKLKLLNSKYFELFQTLVQICFIAAILVFVGVAGNTALKIQDLKDQIREEECIPSGMETFTPGVDDESEELLQGLEINKSNKSPSVTPSSSPS